MSEETSCNTNIVRLKAISHGAAVIKSIEL